MNDQERTTDFLCSEKKLTNNYDTYASECVNSTLRDEFLNISKSNHMIQSELFQQAQGRGWYSVDPAPSAKVTQVYQKFSKI